MSGVEATRTEYDKKRYMWRSVRDALEGSDAVKRANIGYLPIPVGSLVDDQSPSMSAPNSVQNSQLSDVYDLTQAPWFHSNPAYSAYLQRARFPDLALNTLRGLLGVATKDGVDYELPGQMNYYEDRATKKGQSLEELFAILLMETIAGGRAAVAVDVDAKLNETRLVPYKTECMTNWRVNDQRGETSMCVLKEVACDEMDEFETEEVSRHLVFRKYRDDSEETAVIDNVQIPLADRVVMKEYIDGEFTQAIIPTLQGTEFEEIPVYPIGSLQNEWDPNPSPLQAIVEIAYSIYRKDADLNQSQYMTCNPIFTISGASGDKVPVMMGSTVALVLENPEAKAYFPKTDTSGLNHVKASITELFDEAARYGATLLGPAPKTAESTDTVKIRQGAQGATLVSIVKNVSKAIEDALKAVAVVEGADPEKVSFNVSTDFAETLLTPQTILALMQLWQNGLYSKESFIDLLINNGFINSADEVEDELARIFSEAPATPRDQGDLDDEDDDSDDRNLDGEIEIEIPDGEAPNDDDD